MNLNNTLNSILDNIDDSNGIGGAYADMLLELVCIDHIVKSFPDGNLDCYEYLGRQGIVDSEIHVVVDYKQCNEIISNVWVFNFNLSDKNSVLSPVVDIL